MKAMILAAGTGTRLQPLTDETPKALIPVRGIPMLEHVVMKIKAAGFTQIIINIHHLGQQIIDFLASKDNFGMDIRISDERKYLLDTGGAIKQAKEFLDSDKPFLVHNVDIFSGADLNAMYDTHIRSSSLATLLVSQRQTSRQLLFNKEDRLCGWRNRETGEVKSYYPTFDPSIYLEYAFGGIHVISPAIFNHLEDWTGKFSIINFYLSICHKSPIHLYAGNNLPWIDVGTLKGLEEAERF